MASVDNLNILLQEDLTIRGGAQLWLMNCGSRLKEAGHTVTFLLPTESLLLPDIQAMEGVSLVSAVGLEPSQKPPQSSSDPSRCCSCCC